MSCGSTPSRVYFTATKPACAPSSGPCLPCPSSGTHYQESVFRNASHPCPTDANLSADAIAHAIGLKLDGLALAPSRAAADSDGVVIPSVDSFSANKVSFVTFDQAGVTVSCSLKGDCDGVFLQALSDSPDAFVDLVAATTTNLVVNFTTGGPSTTLTRADAVGATPFGPVTGFFSA